MATTPAKMPETVTVDGKHYNLSDLSETARTQLPGLRYVDGRTQLLNNRKALVETARAVYARALAEHMPESKAPANRKKDVITVDGERYKLEDFSEEGQAQLVNIQFADRELERLTNEIAVGQMARAGYAGILARELKGLKPIKTQ